MNVIHVKTVCIWHKCNFGGTHQNNKWCRHVAFIWCLIEHNRKCGTGTKIEQHGQLIINRVKATVTENNKSGTMGTTTYPKNKYSGTINTHIQK